MQLQGFRYKAAIHTSELDRSEIDLSPKRSECERSNANWDRSKSKVIWVKSDLNVNAQMRTEIDLSQKWSESKAIWMWTLNWCDLRSI